MNDSFLEDLGLVEQKTGSTVRDAKRYITPRHEKTPRLNLQEDFEMEIIIKEQTKTFESPVMPKRSSVSSVEAMIPKDTSQFPTAKKLIDSKQKRKKKEVQVNTNVTSRKSSGKKVEIPEGKLKPVENVDRLEESKARGKRPGGSRESSRLSDGSSKENSRPSSSSTHNSRQEVFKERRRGKIYENPESSNYMMLNAVKEMVSSCTKTESDRIMRMMQDLYINSQSNLIKQLILITDDIKALNPTEGSPRFQTLVRGNSQLLENVAFLRCQVEDLQKRVEEMEKLKQENLMLKTRIREFEK